MEIQPNFSDPTGKYNLKFQGAYPVVQAIVRQEDGPTSFKANGGRMLSMSGTVDFKSKIEGSVAKGLMRAAFTGASVSFMHFHIKPDAPPGAAGDVVLAPTMPGDIALLDAQAGGVNGWLLAKDAFMACDNSVSVGLASQGLMKGVFSGAGLFILKAEGVGRLLICSYGSILKFVLQPGEVRKIDNGFLVAWSSDIQYTIGKSSSSLKAAIMSGEGVCATFTGPGTVYAQTRSIDNLREILTVA